MLRRLLIGSVCTSVLAVAAPATADTHTVSTADRTSAAVAVKKVVRQYGDGPVAVAPEQQLVLRFKGKRGDRVRLGSEYRHKGKPYYGSPYEEDVALSGARTTPRLGVDGFFRLRETGWFTLRYDNPKDGDGALRHVQLFKQVRLAHGGRDTTRLPLRRGIQYAVTVRAPRSGIDVVSFGQWPYGVVAQGEYAGTVESSSLVFAPGLPVHGNDPTYGLTKPLKAGQKVTVLADPSSSGRVTTTVPSETDATLDGPAVKLPAGATEAVVVELDAADLAVSAQRLLNVRLVGAKASYHWTALVLPEGGGVAEPSAAAFNPGYVTFAPLYQLNDTAGTYRVLVFPTSHKAAAAEFELDSVADGGAIAVDGAPVSVPVRADGRFTLLGITQPPTPTRSYLSVTDVTVPGRWAVYAGRLTGADCSPPSSSGCGDGNGVTVTSPGTQSYPQLGGYVLAMPGDGQTTGSFSVRLSTTYSP